MKHHYSLLIQWSQEDQLYLVTLPEFAEIAMQPCTYGKTYKEAVQNAQEAIANHLKYREDGGISPPSLVFAEVA